MKITKKILIVFLLYFGIFNSSFASNSVISREDAFIFFANQYKAEIPESFQYIDLKYKDVKKDSNLEDALQILVYKNLILNSPSNISPKQSITVYTFEKLAEKIIQISASKNQEEGNTKSLFMTQSDLDAIQELLNERSNSNQPISITVNSKNKTNLGEKGKIFYDVYETLSENHYDKDNFSQNQLVEAAISGLTNGTNDTYTTYFPPTESKDFFDGLEGEYEGIGAYVDMPTPGVLIIVSPMVGSPAEEAGLKGGDIVTYVDEKKVTEKNSIHEVVSWIKGPANSTVILTVQREGQEEVLKIPVKRAKIILKDIEYKKLNSKTFYVQIKNFGDKVDTDFKEALESIKEDSQVKKIIFDLRNNPGGYLGEVSNILSYFVPKGEPTAIVSYGSNDLNYKSLGFSILDFNNYELIFLQNGGSASASEIMIGSVKDYFPETTIIGEQSFGKGSVQSLKSYYDGSTLKYTVAKWFTGKTRQGIDKVGINPDIELEFDDELWKISKKDNQLDKALSQ